MTTATKTDLNDLHAFVCREITSLLKDSDPEVRLKALSHAIKFLKDNHIESIAEAGSSLGELMDEVAALPFTARG